MSPGKLLNSPKKALYVPGTGSRQWGAELTTLTREQYAEIYAGERLTIPAECELLRAGWRPDDLENSPAYSEALKSRVLVKGSAAISSSDQRIGSFLNTFYAGTPLPAGVSFNFPARKDQIVMSEPGMARKLSIPKGQSEYRTPEIESYRLGVDGKKGILHNPASSKRTTEGTFHVVEGGQLIPIGKIAVPKIVGARILSYVLNEFPKNHADMMEIPYTVGTSDVLHRWVTLNSRPKVMPELKGISGGRFSEVSIMVPGRFISNIDFLEEIFGNAGDGFDLLNNAEHDLAWSGTTHKIILAPQLHTFLTKKDLAIENKAVLEATLAAYTPESPEGRIAERRLADKMYWEKETELYNCGRPFKMVWRDESGCSITLFTDNYYGYGKKSIKSEGISLVANVMGLAEEEHAGGAIVRPREDVGQAFSYETHLKGQRDTINFTDTKELLKERIVDRGYYAEDQFIKIIYLNDNAKISVEKGKIYWEGGGAIVLDPRFTYMYSDGISLNFEKEAKTDVWRLVLTHPDGAFIHKPNTVSGAGKSELSKMLMDAISVKHFTVDDFDKSMAQVREIINGEYGHRFTDEFKRQNPDWDSTRRSRSILDEGRTLDSVIKLLTASDDYVPEYNNWLNSIPPHIKKLVYLVKRRYRHEMGDDWHKHYSVDECDGANTRVLRFRYHLNSGHSTPIKERELRVGYGPDGREKKFSLRLDFMPALKLSKEDDITNSAVISSGAIVDGLPDNHKDLIETYNGNISFKLADNSEYYLFQRPDGAKHRGEDRKTEHDFGVKSGIFASNFEPITVSDARKILSRAEEFDRYSEPMKRAIREFARSAADNNSYMVVSDQARIERDSQGNPLYTEKGGERIPLRSDNPRYLEATMAIETPELYELGDIASHLARQVAIGGAIYEPVDAVISGQRFSPSEKKLHAAAGVTYSRPLLTNNPLHYMPLPEYLMSIIPSLTPKSVSTTGGAGTEGVNTKEAFNALPGIYDIEASLVSMILTRSDAFVSAGGYIGPKYKINHDVSVLIPEIWCRMSRMERSADWLISNGYLEKVEVRGSDGKMLKDADLLGYRSTRKFWLYMGGRIFNAPDALFNDEMLQPETQDIKMFEESLANVVEAQRTFSRRFFADRTIELASVPVRALLHIMRDGYYEAGGERMTRHSESFRRMFTYEYLIENDWYKGRLDVQQASEVRFWSKRYTAIKNFLDIEAESLMAEEVESYRARLESAGEYLMRAKSREFRAALVGTIGLHAQPAAEIHQQRV